MKENIEKSFNAAAESLSTLEDSVLELIAGGEALQYLTEEEAREIVRRNVEWNEERGCSTSPESQELMVKQRMKQPINRAELEKRGGISYFFPK